MAITNGNVRIPLTGHGLSFAIKDVDDFTGNERMPLISDGASMSVLDARTNGGPQRIPLASGTSDEGTWCTADDIKNWGTEGGGDEPWTLTVLGLTEGFVSAVALNISNTGIIVGAAIDAEERTRAVWWDEDNLMHVFGEMTSEVTSTAYGISRDGLYACGYGRKAFTDQSVPLVWDMSAPDDPPVELVLPDGFDQGAARMIGNTAGIFFIAGNTTVGGFQQPTVFSGADLTDLTVTLLPGVTGGSGEAMDVGPDTPAWLAGYYSVDNIGAPCLWGGNGDPPLAVLPLPEGAQAGQLNGVCTAEASFLAACGWVSGPGRAYVWGAAEEDTAFLDTPEGVIVSLATSISFGGTRICGMAAAAGPVYTPLLWDDRVMLALPVPDPYVGGEAARLKYDDGSVAVGFVLSQVGPDLTPRAARWDFTAP